MCGDYERVLYICNCDAWRCHNLERIVEIRNEFCVSPIWCLVMLQFGKNFGYQEGILETYDCSAWWYIAHNLYRPVLNHWTMYIRGLSYKFYYILLFGFFYSFWLHSWVEILVMELNKDCKQRVLIRNVLLESLLLFILTANGFLSVGSVLR
jgi:hypothetical protein